MRGVGQHSVNGGWQRGEWDSSKGVVEVRERGVGRWERRERLEVGEGAIEERGKKGGTLTIIGHSELSHYIRLVYCTYSFPYAHSYVRT